jgi:hypothetical protein
MPSEKLMWQTHPTRHMPTTSRSQRFPRLSIRLRGPRSVIVQSSLRAILAVVLLAYALPCLAQTDPRRVLVLTSFEQQFLPHNVVSAVFREELTLRSQRPVQFVDVSVPSSQSWDHGEGDATLAYLDSTFAIHRPDLIVSIGGVTAIFAQKYRDRIFPGTPLLLSSVDQRFVDSRSLRANETAVAVAIDERQIVENILQLFPDTTTLAIVVGASSIERAWREDFIRAFQPFTSRLCFIWFNDLSFNDMLKRSAILSPHPAILFAHLGIDARGVAQVEDRALPEMRRVADAPIFGVFNRQLGHGIVGGPVLNLDEVGRSAAIAALRILQGESPQRIVTPAQRMGTPMFDAAELARWGIADSRVPPGSVVAV